MRSTRNRTHRCRALGALAALAFGGTATAADILLFVPHEGTYYSEYAVMRNALEAAGHTVDVRSAVAGPAGAYLYDASLVDTANSLTGSSYAEFTAQFEAAFGATWPAADDEPTALIPVDGALGEVASMASYDALVVVGGIGATSYRVDGSYAPNGSASALEVQATAEHLNALALEALAQDKPVLGQCHGASVPAFWRIPGTVGPGAETEGYSLLKGGEVTGFPEFATQGYATDLDISLRAEDRVTISSPHGSFYTVYGAATGAGANRILTSRDWYPQTIAFAARTLLNMLETWPARAERQAPVSTLLIHGGAVDPMNCGAGNRANDIPCNFGGGANLPADYTHLLTLLNADVPGDDYAIDVTDIDLTAPGLPFDPNDAAAIGAYLAGFDSVLFFKHWAGDVTEALQHAIGGYVDAGGTLVGLHHAAYNDHWGGFGKDALAELFGVQSSSFTWSGSSLQAQNLTMSQLGHFVTSFGISGLPEPTLGPGTSLPAGANASFSTYPRIPISDEIYNNWEVLPGQAFGREVGDLQPLLSNDGWPVSQAHIAGLTRYFDPSGDGTVGKIVYLMSGERPESFDPAHPYGQLVRNAIVWSWATVPSPAEPEPPVAEEPPVEEPPAEDPPAEEPLPGDGPFDPSTLGDEFEDPASLADWQRLFATEGWSADPLLGAAIADGALALTPSSSTWWQDRIGALAFRELAGDFVMTTSVLVGGDFAGDPAAWYSLAGLMVRAPMAFGYDALVDFATGQQHYYNLVTGFTTPGAGPRVLSNWTRWSQSGNPDTPISHYAAELRIARLGNVVIGLFREPGGSWQIMQVITDSGLPATVQAGVTAVGDYFGAASVGPFTHNDSTVIVNPAMAASFEYVRFESPAVPPALQGVDPASLSDPELLSFLGDD